MTIEQATLLLREATEEIARHGAIVIWSDRNSNICVSVFSKTKFDAIPVEARPHPSNFYSGYLLKTFLGVDFTYIQIDEETPCSA